MDPRLGMTLLLSGCVTAACATGAAGGFRPAGTPSAAPRQAVPEQSVMAQYRLFHKTVERALETNDESHINEVATGPMAARLTRTVRRQRQEGVVRRGHSVLNPRLTTLAPPRAVILDCVVTHGLWTYRVRTGARAGSRPRLQHARLRTVLVKSAAGWRVTESSALRDPRC